MEKNKEIIEQIKSGSLSLDLDTNDAELVNANLRQMRGISKIIADCLKEGTDYGVIPGIKNQQLCLLQSGADKILLLFGLRAKFNLIEKLKIPNGYEITMECCLVKINDESKVVYNSFASASNAEGKSSTWPLDTVVKMAQKRAKVWATKSIGGLSDMFIDEEGAEAIRKSHLITTKQFNDLYKHILNEILKTGVDLKEAQNTLLKPAMIKKIIEWNKVSKVTLSGLQDLPKTEYDNFIKFLG